MLEDMLRACVLDHKGSWEEYLPLVVFAYNNNYQASIQMAPYEALYGRPCRSPTRIKISVNTDISVIGFYGNIGNIGKYRLIF